MLNELKDIVGKLKESADFSCLKEVQQLGLKTVLLAGDVKAHNRFEHSLGASELGTKWCKNLLSSISMDNSDLATLVEISLLLHDAAHIPFTHLAEEVFNELHWVTEKKFRIHQHDQAWVEDIEAQGKLWEGLKSESTQQKSTIYAILSSHQNTLPRVASIIKGIHPFPWVNGIANSPLDADKIDYLFRDAYWIRRATLNPKRLSKLSESEETLDDATDSAERDQWKEMFFSDQTINTAGIINLGPVAGLAARELIELRHRLYENHYESTPIRLFECLLRKVLVTYLCLRTSSEIAEERSEAKNNWQKEEGDTRAKKGIMARSILWKELLNCQCEKNDIKELLLFKNLISSMLQKEEILSPWVDNSHPRALEWIGKVKEHFDKVVNQEAKNPLLEIRKLAGKALAYGPYQICVTDEQRKRISEYARSVEWTYPYTLIIDVRKEPCWLSYPKTAAIASPAPPGYPPFRETFTVAHANPDRWGSSSNKRVPLSETEYGKRDQHRKLLISAYDPWLGQEANERVWDCFYRYLRGMNINLQED